MLRRVLFLYGAASSHPHAPVERAFGFCVFLSEHRNIVCCWVSLHDIRLLFFFFLSQCEDDFFPLLLFGFPWNTRVNKTPVSHFLLCLYLQALKSACSPLVFLASVVLLEFYTMCLSAFEL